MIVAWSDGCTSAMRRSSIGVVDAVATTARKASHADDVGRAGELRPGRREPDGGNGRPRKGNWLVVERGDVGDEVRDRAAGSA